MSKQAGFSHLVLILLIVSVFLAVGFVGWKVYDSQKVEAPVTNSETTTQSDKPVESSEDVADLENELNNIPIDSELDSAEIDQTVSDLQ
ncbi:MAG: hypothetical protein MUF85_01220 [Patescibacteria group bacterium]|nr:hypothetical protein [Patescibacteria group bacterium]